MSRRKLTYVSCPNCHKGTPLKYRNCGHCGFDLTKRKAAQDAILNHYKKHGIGPNV